MNKIINYHSINLSHNCQEILDQLKQSWINNSLGNSIIISGREISAIRELSIQLGAFILNDGKNEDTQLHCQRIIDRSHPDSIYLFSHDENTDGNKSAGSIKVDKIRKMNRHILYTNAESENKIAIIDKAEDMNENASNALLKTLEEPPVNSLIILLSLNYSALPKTILSRCAKFRIPPMDKHDFTNALQSKYMEIENQHIDELYSLSGGDVQSACEIIDNNGIGFYNDIVSLFADYPELNKDNLLQMMKISLEANNWTSFVSAFSIFIHSLCIYMVATDKNKKLSEVEQITFAKITQKQNLGKVINLFEQTMELVKHDHEIYLDKKILTLKLINSL